MDSGGYDAGKEIKGKKRNAADDRCGFVINFSIMPTDVQDRDMTAPLMKIAPAVSVD